MDAKKSPCCRFHKISLRLGIVIIIIMFVYLLTLAKYYQLEKDRFITDKAELKARVSNLRDALDIYVLNMTDEFFYQDISKGNESLRLVCWGGS